MKSPGRARRRGQPLIALVLVLVSWVGARAALWENAKFNLAQPQVVPINPPRSTARSAAPQNQTPAVNTPAQSHRIGPRMLERPVSVVPAAPLAPPNTQAPPPPAGLPDQANALHRATVLGATPLTPRVAFGHQELWLAGMNLLASEPAEAMGEPPLLRPMLPAVLAAAAGARAGRSHWSVDGWLLLRPGGNFFNAPGAGLPGAVVPTGFYGGSQGGLIIRYFLAPGSKLDPAVYLRGSSGIQRPRGEELAAGFSLRPVPGLPLRVLAEARATRTINGTIMRPAAALVSELPPARQPLGLRGETYLQAGYVGGRGATAFVDGQARLERPLVHAGGFALRAGGGVWGGAQRGASRLDVGPTATVSFRLGAAQSRVSADYRWRVAGNAAPGSGPVVTLSAGF